MLDYKRKNKSTHSFIHSLNQGKQQKPGKLQQQQQHGSYILLLQPQLISFRHDLERRDAGKAASNGTCLLSFLEFN
jgi:hypothetical protein